MTKEQIEKKLKDAWIKKGSGWRMHTMAKKIICPDHEDIGPLEYAVRIKILTEYLKM